MDTVTIPREQAIRYGMLVCKCGHKKSQYLSFSDPPWNLCAYCFCRGYHEIFTWECKKGISEDD